MLKVIKTGLVYVLSIAITIVLAMYVDLIDNYQLHPNNVYRVYLDGEVIGNIKNKEEFENYINNEQKELKEKYDVDKVYVPTGVDIQKHTTYKKEVLSAKEVHNLIKDKKPFTVKGYKILIKKTSEEDQDREIYVLDKKIFDVSAKAVLKAFVTEEEIKNFENDTQPEIKETGSLIEDIYIDQNITIKESYISTDNKIFKDEKELSKYLLFGDSSEDKYYTVKEGDTIETIAYNNKLAVEEFLIVNPEFTSKNNLLSVGQQVKVALINPMLDIVVERHSVMDQESKYKTITQYDSNMAAGLVEVKTQGQNGKDRLTTKLKIVNGETHNVVIVGTETIIPAVNKVVVQGTKNFSGGTVVATGDWAWPTISKYYISSYYGYRWGKFHEAIDIAGSGEGSPIFAAGDGTVIAAKVNAYSLGTYVTINHNTGYYTIYGHMRNLTVREGQTVTKGQQIGTMGHTGFATGTHLHFGLYKNGIPYRGGIPLDPLSLYR